MKLKLIGTLAVLTGLCITSCRTADEMEEVTNSTNSKNTFTRMAKENKMKKDSTASFLDNDEKDPPVRGNHWKIRN